MLLGIMDIDGSVLLHNRFPGFWPFLSAQIIVVVKEDVHGSGVGYWKDHLIRFDFFSLMYALSRSTTLSEMKTVSISYPLLRSLVISFRSSMSLGMSLRASLIPMPPRVISSSMRRFLKSVFLKSIGLSTSFSRMPLLRIRIGVVFD